MSNLAILATYEAHASIVSTLQQRIDDLEAQCSRLITEHNTIATALGNDDKTKSNAQSLQEVLHQFSDAQQQISALTDVNKSLADEVRSLHTQLNPTPTI